MKKFIFFFFLFIPVLAAVSEEGISDVRIIPGIFWEKASLWPERLSELQIIESSLSASGLSGERLDLYMKRYIRFVDKFTKKILPSIKDGDDLLLWIHSNLFTDYRLDQSSMDILLDTGKYNCVSSAILYLVLSKATGFMTEVIEVPDHAFCRVKTADGWIDVETTTPYGFNPGEKKEFVDDFKRTGFVYVPSGNYSDKKILSDKEAVALIIQNRMSLLQKGGRHKDVVGLAVDRWTFENTPAHYRDMRNAFRNYVADLNTRHRYLEGYSFFSKVSGKYSMKKDNYDLISILAGNYILDLMDKKDFLKAEEFLSTEESNLSEQDLQKIKSIIYKTKLNFIISVKNPEESLAAVRNAFSSEGITKKEWADYLYYLHSNRAVEISRKEGYWAAYIYLVSLPDSERQIKGFEKLGGQMHYNWEVSVHNAFADLINNKDTAGASELLKTELKKDPGSSLLLNDLLILGKME